MIKTLDNVIIIIFAYCQEKYIEEAVRSVFNQTIFPEKLIIIDDFSKDDTRKIIEKVVEDSPDGLNVECRFSEENKKFVGQINTLRGEFQDALLIFISGDDYIHPCKVEKTYSSWINQGKPCILHSSMFSIDSNSIVLDEICIKDSRERTLKNIVDRKIIINGCSQSISSKVLNDFDDIDNRVINEDRVLILRAVMLSGCGVVNDFVHYYRVDSGISYLTLNNAVSLFSYQKILLERELIDLECSLGDALKINSRKSELIIRKRIKYISFLNDYMESNDIGHSLRFKWIFRAIFVVPVKFWDSCFRKMKRFRKMYGDLT